MQTATITQKGQFTIPKELRVRFNIKTRDKLSIREARDHIKIFPTQDILAVAGKFKPSSKKPVLAARRALDRIYRRI